MWTERWRLLIVACCAFAAGCGESSTPALLIVSPAAGSARGGDEVVILGAGFVEPTRVWFGEREAQEIVSITASEARVVTPAALAGTVDVVVETGGGDPIVLGGGFSYLPLDLSFAEAPPHYLPDLAGLDVAGTAAADFDLDGDLDVVLGVRDGTSRLLANNGYGEFVDTAVAEAAAGSSLAIRDWDSSTNGIVAQDFDQDGDVDIFACNGGDQMSQLFVNSDGVTFRESFADLVRPDGGACVTATATDVNGDGWTDIALVEQDSSSATPYHLRVLLGRGDAEEQWFEFASDLEPSDIVEGDPVGAVGVEVAGTAAVFSLTEEQSASGAGAGRTSYDFAAAAGTLYYGLAAPNADEPPSAIALEFLGDGSGLALDLYVLDAEGERYTYPVGTTTGTAWESIRATDPASWTPVGGDADGVFDPPANTVGIAVTSSVAGAVGDLFLDDVRMETSDGRTYLVEGFERPVFELAWADDVSSMADLDADGDGDLDLVLSSLGSVEGRYLRLLTNRGDPNASPATATAEVWFTMSDTPSLPPVPDPVAHVSSLDVDGDGDGDLLALARGGQDRLLVNDGSGHFFDDSFVAMPVDWSDGQCAASADLDLDGLPDLVIANWGAVNRLYVNDGVGGFDDATPDMPLYDRYTSHVLAFDVDGDGDRDIFEINGADEAPGLFVSVEPDDL